MSHKTISLVIILAVLALSLLVPVAVAQYQTKIYFDNGGDRLMVAPTGQVVVESGGGLRLTPGAVADVLRYKSTPGLTKFCSSAAFTGTQAVAFATHGLTGGILHAECWMISNPAGKAATCSTAITGITATIKTWNTALTPVAGEGVATVGYCVTGY